MTRLLLAFFAALVLGPGLAVGASSKTASAPTRDVVVSYSGLIDPDTIVRTGERLSEAVRRPERRGAVQPFVERFSFLLPHAVTMLFGPDAEPRRNIADRYEPGSSQPAWAALLRSGRLQVAADGRGRVRIFVPGDDPRVAYRRHYGVLRHPLTRLAAEREGALEVEVFAYRNDYRTSELRLRPTPYRFRAKRFPAGGTSVNLGELDRFFRQGGTLEGAELSRAEGLVLYASPGGRPTLSGKPVALADLAVAYRAVFHAGDNEAFVSLDPHRDPTLATVNFGGLLEDTRIGAVVLTADERFKTVCSGLDSATYDDVRAATRRVVPSFLTNTERSFLLRRTPGSGSWISTRYWYYPGSCGVDSDPGGRLAAITRPRFSADAERSGEEYLGASAKTKKAALPPEVRENIRDLNTNYSRYAKAFPEVRELSAVARLMAICSWLKRAQAGWLDLDGLLAAELPAAHTAREVPRLLTAEFLEVPSDGGLDADTVRRRTRVIPINADLDRPAAEVFGNPAGLAAFLALRRGKDGSEKAPERVAEAQRLFEAERGHKARSLLRTEPDLRAFLRFVASRSAPGGAGEMDADAARLRRVQARLAEIASAGAATDELSAEEERLKADTQAIMKKYHGQGGTGGGVYTVVQHTGGISMEPRLFQVRKPKASPALQKLRQASRGTGGWTRSRPAPAPEPVAGPRSAPAKSPPTRTATRPSPPAARAPAVAKKPPPIPKTPPADEELAAPAPPRAPALKRIEVATAEAGQVVGRLADDGRIVFTREGR